MEDRDETRSFMPTSPFLMPCFIGIENNVRGRTVDVRNSGSKIVNNCFR
jgi:hypothetical protein